MMKDLELGDQPVPMLLYMRGMATWKNTVGDFAENSGMNDSFQQNQSNL